MRKNIDKCGKYCYQAFYCISKESDSTQIPVDFTLFMDDDEKLEYLEIKVNSDRKVLIDPKKELTPSDIIISCGTLDCLENEVKSEEIPNMINVLHPKSKEIFQRWQDIHEKNKSSY